MNKSANLCAYGLYAVTNAVYLRKEGIQTALGGEFEQGLCDLATRVFQIAQDVCNGPRTRQSDNPMSYRALVLLSGTYHGAGCSVLNRCSQANLTV